LWQGFRPAWKLAVVRNKLALLAGAAIIATLTIVATPGVSSAAETVNWSATGALSDAGTSSTPAMTTCNGVTYMVWKGVDNDAGMYYSSSSTPGVWAPQQLVGGGGGTSTGPTVACDFDNFIVVAWKGVGNDERMFYTMAEVENSVDEPTGPLQWSAQKQVDGGGLTDLSPSLAVVRGGSAYLAWRGAGNDMNVYMATLSSLNGPWQFVGAVPGVSTFRRPTLTVGASGPSMTPQVSLIWPLANGQNNFYNYYLGGGRWSSSFQLVGGSNAAPAATEGPADGYNPPDNLVAWQGAGNDTRIFYTVDQNQTGWQPQQLVTNGGPTTTGIAAGDNVGCPNGICTQITAYIAWEGPQEQIEYVYGTY